MSRISGLWVIGVMAAVAVLAACASPGAVNDYQRVELRTYSVPHGFESEVRSMLRNALGSEEDRIGRVDLGPAGKLVVVAPPSIQEGIRKFIGELEALGPPPPPPPPVTMTYWMIVGQAMGSSNVSTDAKRRVHGDYAVVGGAQLGELASVMEQIVETQGPIEFTLLERLRLSSIGDHHAEVVGKIATVRQRATTVQDSVVADVEFRLRGGHNLSTQVKLQPGQLLVLGETGYSGQVPVFGYTGPAEGLTLYYVIASDFE